MSLNTTTQLVKPLTGQYGFIVDADRQQTLANLGFGSTAAAANAVVAKLSSGDGAAVALTDGASVAIDWSLDNSFTWTAATTTTVTFSNTVEKTIRVSITGGSAAAITWPAVIWQTGVAPNNPQSTKHQLLQFVKIGASIYGSVVSDDDTYPISAPNQSASNFAPGANVTLDWSLSNSFTTAINGGTVAAMTLAFSNKTAKSIQIFIAVTGTPTLTWPTTKWVGGTAPAVPATGKIGWYSFYWDGATLYGRAMGLDVA